jgi:hypothetical protein
MSLVISKVFTYDTDAGDYIQRVEGASGDNQALEPATRQAINNFVIGCKQDGIWNAIKASCILSGARTLNGALQPLAGTAPTPVAFVSGDYNRKTGLVGNGTSKYLNSNRNIDTDPTTNQHLSVYVTTQATTAGYPIYIGGDLTGIIKYTTENQIVIRHRNLTANVVSSSSSVLGLIGASRANGTGYTARVGGASPPVNQSSSTPTTNIPALVFANGTNSTPNSYSNARLAFYSIGESLDLALLDARVTALITAFGVAIP